MVSGEARDDPAARVDALVAAIGPRLDAPAINRLDVVLVTGPWMAGVTGVVAALRERLPQHKFVESTDLGPGDAPIAVVFVVSAAAQLTESDCVLLEGAAEHTDLVVGVVSKIDVHRNWRDMLTANRDTLAAHAPRYGQVPWMGVAAVPDLGEPVVDDLIETVSAQLADSDIARRNRLRAWESRLQTVGQRFDRDAEGAGRRVRVGLAGATPVEIRADHHAARPDSAGAGPVVLLCAQPVLVGARRTARGRRGPVQAQDP
jgi:hypothetical protein